MCVAAERKMKLRKFFRQQFCDGIGVVRKKQAERRIGSFSVKMRNSDFVVIKSVNAESAAANGFIDENLPSGAVIKFFDFSERNPASSPLVPVSGNSKTAVRSFQSSQHFRRSRVTDRICDEVASEKQSIRFEQFNRFRKRFCKPLRSEPGVRSMRGKEIADRVKLNVRIGEKKKRLSRGIRESRRVFVQEQPARQETSGEMEAPRGRCAPEQPGRGGACFPVIRHLRITPLQRVLFSWLRAERKPL